MTGVLNEPLKKLLGARSANPIERELGLVTAEDLLRHYPRRYLDLGQLTNIGQLPLEETVSFVAEVRSVSAREMRSRRGKLIDVVVTDGNESIDLTFFNQMFVMGKLRPGVRALFSGKVTLFRNTKQMASPRFELMAADDDPDRAGFEEMIEKPYPVYPAKANVSSDMIMRAVRVVLDQLPAELPDPVPEDIRLRRKHIDLRRALRQIHRPADRGQIEQAEQRFRFEEAFVLQTVLARRRAEARELMATACPPVARGLKEALDARLPFELTEGQREVGEQIAADLNRRHPMQRLLQGEVGSGKTMVALRAMLQVVDNRAQAALLAPTEVLATQHHRSITTMLGDLAGAGMLGSAEVSTRVTLLTGSMSAPARRAAMLEMASGQAGIVIGTHALIQEKVQFENLGMVVVDEQHRFGVEQRDALRAKGRTVPHVLVMTATPIPRTVAMTVFGDLETSTLRQLPAGRSPITTHLVNLRDQRWIERTWERLAEEAKGGHQSYVVCPRIGDDGKEDELEEPPPEETEKRRPAIAVLELVEHLREVPALAGLVIEPLHGRMPADEREAIMSRFGRGEVHVLVSTTVIEVGVDVPNATAMVVMDADRFGVSQLHQLRGRVGRGSAPGLCLLVSEITEGPTAERLQAVAASSDGFELARVDLEQRREGDVLGARQSGVRSSLRKLRVLRDEKVIAAAREEATRLVGEDPSLDSHPELVGAVGVWLGAEQEAYLDRG
jgi:ATP-dependent DNA helicase RecG